MYRSRIAFLGQLDNIIFLYLGTLQKTIWLITTAF